MLTLTKLIYLLSLLSLIYARGGARGSNRGRKPNLSKLTKLNINKAVANSKNNRNKDGLKFEDEDDDDDNGQEDDLDPTSALNDASILSRCNKATSTYTSCLMGLKNIFLMTNDVEIPPFKRTQDTVNVDLELYVVRVLELDELGQHMKASFWVKMTWQDHRLTWDPKKFMNITDIHMKANSIWIPDLTLYNSADGPFTLAENLEAAAQARVDFQGNISWMPLVHFTTDCRLSLRNFPFDVQMCHLKLGSWTYDKDQINLRISSNDTNLSEYVRNPMWSLKKAISKRTVEMYHSTGDLKFVDVKYYLIFKRDPKYYLINIVIPTLIFGILVCFVFYLPADSGERLSLSLSVLISESVFQILVMGLIPKATEETPILTIFLTMLMIMTLFSIIFTTIILRFHLLTFDDRPCSTTWRVIFDTLAPILGIEDHGICEKMHNLLLEIQRGYCEDPNFDNKPKHILRGVEGGVSIHESGYSQSADGRTFPRPFPTQERIPPRHHQITHASSQK